MTKDYGLKRTHIFFTPLRADLIAYLHCFVSSSHFKTIHAFSKDRKRTLPDVFKSEYKTYSLTYKPGEGFSSSRSTYIPNIHLCSFYQLRKYSKMMKISHLASCFIFSLFLSQNFASRPKSFSKKLSYCLQMIVFNILLLINS